ncbi:MAG: hypothetical protein JWM34_3495 [Ilumatobacteraceae bacterium]|nr:hypothetical protein [Ilumatobacteraceae bacterium]
MRRGRWGGVLGPVAGAIGISLLVPACSSDSAGAASVKTADAYSAAIRWYLGSVSATTPTTAGSGPLVVYVAPENGKAINSEAQASVVKDMSQMSDVVTVRFADIRDDALETNVEDMPVKNDGVLLLVGEVRESAPPVEVDVDVYRSAVDTHSFVMRVTGTSGSFEATQVSEVVQG